MQNIILPDFAKSVFLWVKNMVDERKPIEFGFLYFRDLISIHFI
jgi:hypothetical protein